MMSWDMRPTAMVAGDAAGAGVGGERRSCFCCGEVGHLARDCLQRVSRKSPGAALTCFACGQPGHFARDCPDKFSRNRPRNRPSRPNRTAGITRSGGPSAGGGEGGPNRTAGGPNRTAGITGAIGTITVGGEGGPNRMSAGSEGGPNCIAGITGAAGTSAVGGEGGLYRTNPYGGEGGPNRAAGITQAAGTIAVGGEGGLYRTNPNGGEGCPNRAARNTQAAGTIAVGVRGEGGSNRTSGITRGGGTDADGNEGGPNHSAGITRPGYKPVDGGDGGPNCAIEITQAGGISAGGREGGLRIARADYTSAGGRRQGGPNRTAGITREGGMGADRGEGGAYRTTGITRAGGMGTNRGEGGPNRTTGITRAGGMGADRGEGGSNRTAGIIQSGGMGTGRGEGGPNHTARITPAGGTGVGGGAGGPNHTVGITRAGGTAIGGDESGPNHTAGITQVRDTGTAVRGLWVRRRELLHTVVPATADLSKDSNFIHGGRIGGVSSLNQTSFFPGTLSPEDGGSGYLPDEPVSQSYHNVNWQYDTGKFFGSSGIAGGRGSSSREYSNSLDVSKGDCGEGSSGSSKDSGEASSARGLFLNEISPSLSGNDFDYDDYKDLDKWLSWALLREGKIMEKRCGFATKVGEGIDGERSSNGKYTIGKSFNNKCTTSQGPAVIEISSSSSEDEEEGIVRKKTTGFLFPAGKVKEEIKRVVGDDTDDDDDDDYDDDYDDNDDDDDCVILECNPFEPPSADFEQKVSLSVHKSSIDHDEDITVISERGQVACRDYPHSRHHCAKFPFSKTTHESCCPLCYCYICEVVAPCEYWDGSCGHCHASDLDPIWGVMKRIYRNPDIRS